MAETPNRTIKTLEKRYFWEYNGNTYDEAGGER